MASLPTHAFTAAVLCRCFFPVRLPQGLIWLAALLAVLPDADVIAFAFGIPYGAPLGHRGFTHSLAFAGLAAVFTAWVAFRHSISRGERVRVVACLFLACASHGLLDALTDGGLGVAFFAPLDNRRYFFPVTPLRVSPIGLRAFFGPWGAAVLLSEFLWVWIPGLAILGVAEYHRRR